MNPADTPDNTDLRNKRAIHEIQLMLGTGVYDLPKLLTILKGQK